MPTRYRKSLALAFFLLALGMIAVACGAEPLTGDCLSPQDGEMVPSDCEVPPGVTLDPTATPTATVPGGTGGDPAIALLNTYGCGACHTINGTPLSGVVGPNLSTIGSHGADYIRQSIVDPNAVIAEGFQPGIMPQTFGSAIPPEDLDAIVEYLSGLQ